jgi:hypothetical protein
MSCSENSTKCLEEARGWGYKQLPEGAEVVGISVQVFDTTMSESFANERMTDDYIDYWQNQVWLTIEISPAGLESYQADDIIATMTY